MHHSKKMTARSTRFLFSSSAGHVSKKIVVELSMDMMLLLLLHFLPSSSISALKCVSLALILTLLAICCLWFLLCSPFCNLKAEMDLDALPQIYKSA